MKKLLICLLIFVGAIFISCNFVINATTTKTVPEQPMIQTEPLSLIVETPAPSTDILLEEEPAPTPEQEPLATREEIELLALCAMAEAEGECEQGQRLVIDSVLNRVDNPHFPDTISEVIWQKNQYAGMYGDRITRCYVTPMGLKSLNGTVTSIKRSRPATNGSISCSTRPAARAGTALLLIRLSSTRRTIPIRSWFRLPDESTV